MPTSTKPPKLGCVSIRHTLLFFSIVAIIGSPCLLVIYSGTLPTTYAGCAFGWLLHFALLFGVLKNNEVALNLTLSLLIVVLLLDIFLLLIIPVVGATLVSSDYVKFMYPGPQYRFMRREGGLDSHIGLMAQLMKVKAETRFWNGIKTAADAGIKIVIHFAVVLLEYGMTKRYYRYVTATRMEEQAMELDEISVDDEHFL